MIYIAQSLTAIHDVGARFTWNVSVDPDVVGYRVYAKEGTAAAIQLMADVGLTGEYVSGPLRRDIEYLFYVTSYTVGGYESEYSLPISIKLDGVVEYDSIPDTSLITSTLLPAFTVGFDIGEADFKTKLEVTT